MPRKLYIHVGPTKTGTTAIQSALSQYAGSAVLYPVAGRYGRGSHHSLVQAFFRDGLASGESKTLFAELAAEVSRSEGRNVLISSEWLIRKRDRLFDFIPYLLNLFGGEWDVELLIGCREHFERAASAYSQNIGGRAAEKRSPDEFLLDRIKAFLYSRITRRLVDCGFKVTALNYHPSNTWLARFLSHIGFPESELPEPQIMNGSLSPKALIASLAANRVLQEDELSIFWHGLKHMPGAHASSQFIFGTDAAAEAETHFAADREFLRKAFGLVLPVPDIHRESMFALTPTDLSEIVTMVEPLGERSRAVVDCAAKFVID